MIKLPFSRVVLSAMFASTVMTTGCDIDSDSDPRPAAQARPPTSASPGSFVPGTHPIFNLGAGTLPTVTDFPFLAAASALPTTFDGTALVANATDPVKDAVNDLDGWSTNAYFDIKFSGSINPATVSSSGLTRNVFLFRLNTSGDALDPASVVLASPVSISTGQPSYTHAVVSLDGGTNNVLRIMPTAPLLPAAKYLVVLTNGIKDSANVATTESASFHALTVDGVGAINSSLVGASNVLRLAETVGGNVLSALSGGAVPVATARNNITVAYTFTTTDPQKPLIAMAAPRAAVVAAGATVAQANGLDGAGLLSTPKARTLDVNRLSKVDLSALTGGALAASVGDMYVGHITLPYYLTAYNGTDDTYLRSMWRANTALATALGKSIPEDTTQTVTTTPTSSTTTNTPNGTRNVTYRYPFAAATGNETIPLQVTLPNSSFAPPNYGGATCGQAYSGGAGSLGTGYPVAIYVHGIMSDRTSVVSLAHALAQQCIATVAIDMPVHGVPSASNYVNFLNVDHAPGLMALYSGTTALHERHFERVQGAGGASMAMNFTTPNPAIDRSGTLFINIPTLQNTRDNLKQAVQDFLNLNASLATLGAEDLDNNGVNDLDTGKVYVIGVSLGGIVGTVFTAVNQAAISQDTARGFTSNLNPIKGLVVSAGGSQLPQILINSATFGPVISAGLGALAPVGTSNRESLLNVAQAAVDSADPVNFAPMIDAMNVPTLVQMIVGGGDTSALGESTTWLSDRVVPNSSAGAPLMGTAPLAALLGATAGPDGAAISAVTSNVLVKQSIGYHSSLLIPNTSTTTYTNMERAATGELQTEAVSFIASAGAGIRIGQIPLGGPFTTGSFTVDP